MREEEKREIWTWKKGETDKERDTGRYTQVKRSGNRAKKKTWEEREKEGESGTCVEQEMDRDRSNRDRSRRDG